MSTAEDLISIVTPMWNEEDTVDALLARLQVVTAAIPRARFEVIVVDDGSTDGTFMRLQSWLPRLRGLRVLRLSRNFGQQAALTAGIDHANGDAVIIMDADLQDPPELIGELIAAWRAGADVGYAVRTHRRGESLPKRATAAAYSRLLRWLSDTPVPVDTGDYRIMSRRVIEALAAMPESDRYLRGLVAWVGFRQVPVPFVREQRHAGGSRYSWGRLVRIGMGGLVGFTDRPLLASLGAGLTAMAAALAAALALIVLVVAGRASVVPGWASLVVLIIFLAAVQLISLGVIGLYVSRLFVEAKRRPLYLLDADSGAASAAGPHCSAVEVAGDPVGDELGEGQR